MSKPDAAGPMDPGGENDVAIVGMAARVPGARNVAEFWRNLRDGVESVRWYTDEELAAAGVPAQLRRDPKYVPGCAALEGREMFDAGFFRMSPRDASIMDPQQRHFLECAWEALEDAGYDPSRHEGPIGVHVGSGMTAYMTYNLTTNRELMDSVGEFMLRHTGNDKDFLATRISYEFDLKGPSVNVQTACSTSLVAVHLACQSLLGFESDMALAGGVTILREQDRGYLYKETEILSPDGHCRSFDASSRGTIFGSGMGIVVLKRLEDALRDGDHIRAVIKGSAINNDGRQKAGYFAPSVDGQASSMAEALAVAGVSADTLSYVEAHGTGTPVGDPIELRALTQAFRQTTDRRGFCRIGSVKSNIGHLDTAAGVAGLIKLALALEHRQIPPTLHFQSPNPECDFDNSPFVVNSALTKWDSAGPRRGAVNSLGVGGTNAQVIVEEAPSIEASSVSRRSQLLLLSARSGKALEGNTARLAEHLRANPATNLADVAYTLQVGRKAFEHRRALVCRDLADAAEALEALDPKRVSTRIHDQGSPSLVFMFPGGGAQYPGMSRGLYECEPLFRGLVDECLAQVRSETGNDLRELMFPNAADVARAAAKLERVSLFLPAIFTIEYALARLWMSWGVRPAAMIGHSLGEYVAACLSGVMTREEALSMVIVRGRLMESASKGAMLSVSLPADEVRELMSAGLSLAADNGPALCAVAGLPEAIASLQQELESRDVDCARIALTVAAHSSVLEPMLDEWAAFCRTRTLRAPQIPYVSNLTGTWITPDEATDPNYWVRHLRQTVRFSEGLTTLFEQDASRVFLEVGPGRTLSSLVRQQKFAVRAAVASIRHREEEATDDAFLLSALGALWQAGVETDWSLFHAAERRRRVPLPTYAFDHSPYWIEEGASGEAAGVSLGLSKRPEIEDWFYVPSWKRSLAPSAPRAVAGEERADAGEASKSTWLVLTDSNQLVDELESRLPDKQFIRLSPGKAFARRGATGYTADPAQPADFSAVLKELGERGKAPERILHLWGLTAGKSGPPSLERLRQLKPLCLTSLLSLAQALARELPGHAVEIDVLSNRLQSVAGESSLEPEKALSLGPCRVIPHEMGSVRCRSIDLELPSRRDAVALERLADQLVGELVSDSSDAVVAWRGVDRWVQTWERAPLPEAAGKSPWLREGGTYLITGGLGGIGRELARHLARRGAVNLVLVGRTALPPRSEWEALLSAANGVAVRERIADILALERAGAKVLVVTADVANRGEMKRALAEARERFGPLHGVFHAAGTVDDSLIQFKSPESVDRVLAAKVDGTLVLHELLRRDRLDFLLLFSSVSAILGLPGQLDYAAANAFLDAYARRESVLGGRTVVSINWSLWQEVGMAVALADAARQFQAAPQLEEQLGAAGDGVAHPMLDRKLTDTANERTFVTMANEERLWVLDGHRTRDGVALLPGAAYPELCLAALEIPDGKILEIRDLFFLAPLLASPLTAMHVELRRRENAWSLTVRSRLPGHEDVEHGRATLELVDVREPRRQSLERLEASCSGAHRSFEGGGFGTQQAHFMRFDGRWRNVREFRAGEGQGLARLELPAGYLRDLDDYAAHPALFDMATALALPLVAGYESRQDFYVPASYGLIRIHGRLGREVFAHVSCADPGDAELVRCDVDLMDPSGLVLIEVRDFVMKRLEVDALTLATRARRSRAEDALPVELAAGISTIEGMEVLDRVLGGPRLSQVVASSIDLPTWMARVERDARAALDDEGVASAPKFSRPELATPYEAPRNEIEQQIAEIWSKLLGVEHVGIHDNFYDLGGQSLLGVRMIEAVSRKTGKVLPLTALFNSSTIAELAVDLGSGDAAGREWTSLVPVRSHGSLPPLFCLHGVGGTVHWGYASLAKHLGPDQPVHGFKVPPEPLKTLPGMAAHYVKEMRELQPEGPYYLGGYCFGGNVAYEMAQILVEQGKEVALLFMIEAWPVNTGFGKIRLSPRWLKDFAGNVPSFLADAAQRPKRELWLALRRKTMKALALLNPFRDRSQSERSTMVDVADVARYAEGEIVVWETNMDALWAHTPVPYPGSVLMLRARRQPLFSPHDPAMGWGDLALGGVESHTLPGTHFNIVDEPYVREVGRVLAERLAVAHERCEMRDEEGDEEAGRVSLSARQTQ